MAYKVLVVDDEEAIRVMLQQFLASFGYETDTACDGEQALAALDNKYYDLILSDINMPHMKGFELLQKVRAKTPHTKRALITAYDVNEYLRLAMEHDIGNIIPKTTPFSFDEIKTVVQNLLTEDVFGLQHYMVEGTAMSEEILTKHAHIEPTVTKITKQISDHKKATRTGLVLTETLTNAIYYGARHEESADKMHWSTNFELPPEWAIHVCWGEDAEKFGFAVDDQAGRLNKKDVLYWMCRQIERDDKGVPLGVFDTHGRGFFIARNYVDSLIINIQAGIRTEIIGLSYHKRNIARHKPLYINEI